MVRDRQPGSIDNVERMVNATYVAGFLRSVYPYVPLQLVTGLSSSLPAPAPAMIAFWTTYGLSSHLSAELAMRVVKTV